VPRKGAANPPYRRGVGDDTWAVGGAYEAYVGRWSRPVAQRFLRWLAVPPGRRWLDVGCGTGALTSAILTHADPAGIVGLDPSAGFLADARTRVADPRVSFHVGDARSLALPGHRFDAVVSGLALNFVPDPDRAAAESPASPHRVAWPRPMSGTTPPTAWR
jgi:trans-aconitate methyltransferase